MAADMVYSELTLPLGHPSPGNQQPPDKRCRRLPLSAAIVFPVCLLFAASITIAVMALRIRSCPEWWQLYKENCYYFSTNKSTWDTSREDCRSRGANLIKVEDQQELDLLRQQSRVHLTFWIGLKRRDKWRWYTGQAFDTNRFIPGSNDIGECGGLTEKGITKLNCSLNHHWICEMTSTHI
ncbi:killer cell lectin-like receptor subfamily G member 1 [Polypterus senegalus]|uniref:killer cell lectin-like receptor subfamily G member 1 n=1 Tax=Polypterus senegalus TaxID=55291 RepID=UPI00196288B2|nr:killer cell lectin-like receptor subfamily G member 1 [Polypterus senegalus]